MESSSAVSLIVYEGQEGGVCGELAVRCYLPYLAASHNRNYFHLSQYTGDTTFHLLVLLHLLIISAEVMAKGAHPICVVGPARR